MYGMSQVDHLLGLRSGTARRWIDGYTRGGTPYAPVIREATTHDETVTWGEFVEARFLASYRSQGVPLVRMRPVVERLRYALQTPYPLAQAHLFVEGRDLVEKVQMSVDLEAPLHLVVVRTGQLVLTPSAQDFYESVEWSDQGDGVALRVLPLGPGTVVALDPERSFGSPSVAGIRTDVIAEEFRAGESADAIAAAYGLTHDGVNQALLYEKDDRAA
jgi:uncharacterized protein (DUF433 family)